MHLLVGFLHSYCKEFFSRNKSLHHVLKCIKSLGRFLGRGCDEALFREEKGFFSEKGGSNSVNEGSGNDFYRKGNSVKRSGRFSEPPDSEN